MEKLERMYRFIYGARWKQKLKRKYEGEEEAKLTPKEIEKLFSKELVEDE